LAQARGRLQQKGEGKPSLKSKHSLKEKPSAIAKGVKKHLKQKAFRGKLFAIARKRMTEGKAFKDYAGSLQGKVVRVVEELAGRHHFGQEGEVIFHRKDGSITLRAGKLQQAILTQENHVCEVANFKAITGEKSLRALDNFTKRVWLEQLHFGYEDSESFQTTFTEYLKPGPKGPHAGVSADAPHLKLFWIHLKWSLQVPAEVKWLDPKLLSVWREFKAEKYDIKAEEQEAKAIMLRQERAMRKIVDSCKLILCPIHSEVAPAHWTLLVIDKTEGPDKVQLRYYDTLQEPSEGNILAATQLLSFLFPGSALPQRRNLSRQHSIACGFTTCWYMEEETRRYLGEGFGSRGWQKGGELVNTGPTGPMGIPRAPRVPMGTHGYPTGPTGPHGNPWASHGPHGPPWEPMAIPRAPRVPMGTNGHPTGPTGPHGRLRGQEEALYHFREYCEARRNASRGIRKSLGS